MAVAHGFDTKSIAPVGATFSATTASNVTTSTCTGADGTYTKSHGTYSGTASSSDPALNGTVTIDASSIVNPGNVGLVVGRIHLNGSGSVLDAPFEAVLAANGTIAGFAQGWESGPSHRLFANISAGFSANGGFSSGMLGGGTGPGGAIEVTPGDCSPIRPPKPEKIGVHGVITAVSSTSISAAGVTCSVPASLQGAVANLHVGDRVELHCTVSGGANTLYQVSADHDGHRHHH